MASLSSRLTTGARRAAYRSAQLARIAWYSGHYAAGRHRMGPITPPGAAPYAEEFGPLNRKRLNQSYSDLFEMDLRNIEAGAYKFPKSLRRPPSPSRLLRDSRDYLRDTGRVARRKQAAQNREVYAKDKLSEFPSYYLQNFHFQTDGWLSEQSAERYDMQVETLFVGAGAVMRRQALPYIGEAVGDRDPASLSLLDMACGDGGFLASIHENWPSLNITGLDLSSSYLAKAQRRLSGARRAVFRRGAAEQTAFAPASFDVITAVYLFHELPPKIRIRVVAEAARLLKPGGAFILVDTLQYGDDPGLDVLLEHFPRGFHEPYYDSYCRADLDELFGAAGFQRRSDRLAFLSKVTQFQKAAS